MLAVRFFMRKLREYEQIRQQIKDLSTDIGGDELPLAEVDGLSELSGKTADLSLVSCTNS